MAPLGGARGASSDCSRRRRQLCLAACSCACAQARLSVRQACQEAGEEAAAEAATLLETVLSLRTRAEGAEVQEPYVAEASGGVVSDCDHAQAELQRELDATTRLFWDAEMVTALGGSRACEDEVLRAGLHAVRASRPRLDGCSRAADVTLCLARVVALSDEDLADERLGSELQHCMVISTGDVFWRALQARGWDVPFFGICARLQLRLLRLQRLPDDRMPAEGPQATYCQELWRMISTNAQPGVAQHACILGELLRLQPQAPVTHPHVLTMLRAAAFVALAELELNQGSCAEASALLSDAENATWEVFPRNMYNLFVTSVPVWPLLHRVAKLRRGTCAEGGVRRALGIAQLAPQGVRNPSATPPALAEAFAARARRTVRPGAKPAGRATADEDRWWQQQLVHVAGAVFLRYDVFWWASHGTLLGAVRHQGPIPHDHDVDLDVLGTMAFRLQDPNLQDDLLRNGIRIAFQRQHHKFVLWPSGRASPALDVFLAIKTRGASGATFSYLSNFAFHRGFRWPAFGGEPAEAWCWRRFGGTRVVVPANYAVYLERMYGPDWNHTLKRGCRFDVCAGEDWLRKARPLSRRLRSYI